LVTALRASADPYVQSLIYSNGNDCDNIRMADWLNSLTTEYVWDYAMASTSLFEATDITKFDTLSAGKRDAWRLMLAFSPLDMRKSKYRKAITDVWGSTDAVPLLQSCLRKATNVQLILGGTTVTTLTVTGLRLGFVDTVTYDDVSTAFQANQI
jgi:hypothetical protein